MKAKTANDNRLAVELRVKAAKEERLAEEQKVKQLKLSLELGKVLQLNGM